MPTPPGVSSLLQASVIKLAGEAKLCLEGQLMADGWIDSVQVGSPELDLVSHRYPCCNWLATAACQKKQAPGH
jgi:hypothetical protein